MQKNFSTASIAHSQIYARKSCNKKKITEFNKAMQQRNIRLIMQYMDGLSQYHIQIQYNKLTNEDQGNCFYQILNLIDKNILNENSKISVQLFIDDIHIFPGIKVVKLKAYP